MRHLITGGAGFIGSHLSEYLLGRGEEVIAFDNLFTSRHHNIEHLAQNKRFEFVRGDVCDRFHFEVDRVWHLACPASPVHYQRNSARTITTGVVGTINALKCARDTGARILIASTSEVYGDPLVHPQVESYWGNVNPVGPRACYDEGKRCAEALAVAYKQQYGVQVRIPRIFNTYGPRMQENDGRVVSSFICQALRGQPMTIFGDGSQSRSFCFISDLVEGLVRLMESNVSDPVNMGNPTETTVRALAEVVIDAVGRGTVVYMDLPQDDPVRRKPDISKASHSLDWFPKVSLANGVKATAEYFRARQ